MKIIFVQFKCCLEENDKNIYDGILQDDNTVFHFDSMGTLEEDDCQIIGKYPMEFQNIGDFLRFLLSYEYLNFEYDMQNEFTVA